ncbi:MAG: sensor domain-containing diguanylate cyclase, partial [Pseudomonadota bacterium]
DKAVGVLGLYASEAGFFQQEEMNLLTELAGDISFAIDHLEKNARLKYLAYYDELTGLANRTLFLERVAVSMRSAAEAGETMALVLIDLERFRYINESLGRHAGDQLLIQVAQLLTDNVQDINRIGRVGADHFAILYPDIQSQSEFFQRVEKQTAAFMEHPFMLNGEVFRLAVKVGIAKFPRDGDNVET